MPTYDYICDNCKHEFEAYESIKADPQTLCPECKQATLRRKIGAGAAILFKGSGFYQTDYRSDSYKKKAEADKPSESKPAASDSSSPPSPSTSSAPAKSEAPKAPVGQRFGVMIRGKCPTCGQGFEIEALDELPSFPFCSPRCRLIDLGRWADGSFAIPGPEAPTSPPPEAEGEED